MQKNIFLNFLSITVSKIIYKLKDSFELDKLNWPNLDELFELSQTIEVFIEDPKNRRAIINSGFDY